MMRALIIIASLLSLTKSESLSDDGVTSDVWVLSNEVYYLDFPTSDLGNATWQLDNGHAHNHTYARSIGHIHAPEQDLDQMITNVANLQQDASVVTKFVQWWRNVVAKGHGNLIQFQDSCWWYVLGKGDDFEAERNCIGSLKNNEVVEGKKNSYLACPSSGYKCMKFNYLSRVGTTTVNVRGSTWCISPDENSARNNGKYCESFAGTERYTLDCSNKS